MPLITWTDNMSVGVGRIDKEHQKLIELINRLHDAMKTGSGKTIVGPVIVELVSYCNTHFADEERRMAACNYAGLAGHKQAHDAFAKQCREFLAQYQSGSAMLSQDVLRMLKDWLVNHIEKMDQGYVSALVGKAA